ncbi:MAG: intein-containing adenosylcobalamin-dependent ribonucleoside-diphosphate reductase, partial [Bacteroidota bacterium]
GNTKNKAGEASGDGASVEPEVIIREVEKIVEIEKVVQEPSRRRLPDERPSLTHKFSIAGHEGYLHIGLYPDTQLPGEIFITMAKQGSTIGGLMDAFATSISLGLQYGVPLEDLCQKFSHMRFEPSGFTNNRQIPMAKSIMDYIFRYLSLKFLGDARETAPVSPQLAVQQEAAKTGPAADTSQADLFTATPSEPTPDPLVGQTVEAFMATQGASASRTKATGGAASTSLAQAAGPQALFQNQSDSPPCSVCGSITVRAGACYQCTNCGASTGCG